MRVREVNHRFVNELVSMIGSRPSKEAAKRGIGHSLSLRHFNTVAQNKHNQSFRFSRTSFFMRHSQRCQHFSADQSKKSTDADETNQATAIDCPIPGSIYNPPTYEPPDHLSKNVKESIRSGLVGMDDGAKDTGMSLLFLGTSAGLPSRARGPTSTLLWLHGTSILIDAGEGTQRQLMFTGAKSTQLDRILITHLHGDHIFGIPGLLLGLQHSYQMMQQGQKYSDQKKKRGSNRNQNHRPHVIKIYGPPGLYNYIASSIILSCTVFHSIEVQVYELVGGRVRRTHGTRVVRNPFEADYPEYDFGRMSRHFIPCGIDGTWTIEDFPPMVTRDTLLNKKDNRSVDSATTTPGISAPTNRNSKTGEQSRFRIQAAEVDHLSGVATFGYAIEEEDPPRNIDAAKALSLGVSPKGKKYDLLKAGFSVYTDDGSREVHPLEVYAERRKRARKVTVVGDNRGWTAAMKKVAQKSDVLVHEATLTEKDTNWKKRGHSTAEMAGKVSEEVGAQVLILNHISPKTDYVDERGPLALIEDARHGSNNKSEVIVAYDFMEMIFPWLGFFPLEKEESSLCKTTSLSQCTLDDKGGPGVDGLPTVTPKLSENNRTVKAKDVLETWFGRSTGKVE